MDIAELIADVLRKNKEVSIAGIGTFYKKTSSASYDERTNTFYPPSEVVCFQQEQADQDRPDQEQIRLRSDFSESSLKYLGNKPAETIKSELELNGKMELPSLGTLEMQGEKYVFTPSQSGTAMRFYGLEPVKELELPVSPAEKTHPLASVSDPSADKRRIDELEKAFATKRADRPPVANPVPLQEEIPGDNGRKRVPSLLIISVVVIVMGAGAYFAFPNLLKGTGKDQQPQQTVVVPEQKPAQKQPETTVVPDSNPVQAPVTTEQAADTLAQPAPDTTAAAVKKDVITYEIIGASLHSEKEAEAYIRQMRAKGVTAKIVENLPGRLIKVSLGSFTDVAKAQKEKQRIQKEITRNAWVLEIKNKTNE